MWRNVVLDPTLTEATSLTEVECVVAVAVTRVALGAKGVVVSPRTVDVAPLSLVGEAAP